MYLFTLSIVGSQLYNTKISSTSACLSLDKGRDFEGSGCQSSVAEVWRTSKFSPGTEVLGRPEDEAIVRFVNGNGEMGTYLVDLMMSGLAVSIDENYV